MIRRIINFYKEGFTEMKFGKRLWLLIFIKLALLFLVLRLVFFKPELAEFDTDGQKARHVKENLFMQGNIDDGSITTKD
ncbi:MAG: DUF4492 domain-containing protein [Candidatus Egerieousia sp.]